MKWYYNGIKYKTIKPDWEEYNRKEKNIQEDILVYNTKWKKCYYLKGLYIQGNNIRANICDIHKLKDIWCDPKNLELVVKDSINE